MRRSILIIHPGALGDILLAVPAMRKLRAQFPQHELVLCSNESAARLLLEYRVIDAWLSVQGRACAELFDPEASIGGELQEWLERCDCAVAWMQDRHGSLARTLEKAGARKAIVCSPFSMTLKASHQSDRFCETVQELLIHDAELHRLQLPDAVSLRGRSCMEESGVGMDCNFTAFHPGSGSPRKSIAIATMATMMARLRGEGMLPIVIEGPADHEAVGCLLQKLPFPAVVLRDLELRTLAAVLSLAKNFVGHDSGVTHLAGLLGVPTIAFFGPTDPDRWAPLGSHVTILKAPHASESLAMPFSDVSATRHSIGDPRD
ncbi:MAG TPA: glycosyltransferase family 9 protein [Nitrospira sp.]|nr:glycosyltransferase family 9 protein [Nitrospira sp.]